MTRKEFFWRCEKIKGSALSITCKTHILYLKSYVPGKTSFVRLHKVEYGNFKHDYTTRLANTYGRYNKWLTEFRRIRGYK